jgi:hypothetical protein
MSPHIPRKFTLQSHLESAIAPNRLFQRLGKRLPRGFDSHRPLHFWWPGVSLRCPRTRRSSSSSSHSLDVATVHLIECRSAFGRVFSRRPHWTVIGPIADSQEWPLSSPQILGEPQQALGVLDKRDAPCINFARSFPRFVWLNRCQSAPPCSLPLHPYRAGDTIGLVSCLHGCEQSDRHRISTVTRWSPHWRRSRDHPA